MPLSLFSFCHFQIIRLLRAQPRVFAALVMSLIALTGAGAGYMTQWQQFNLATQELRALQANAKPPGAALLSDKPARQVPSDLPVFESASLMKALSRIAGQIKLPLNEISYALDDNTSQPFLRYHVTLTVTSAYPVIRRFVDELHVGLPNVTLDAISCARADIAAANLTCDLVFSAFFRKDALG